MAKTNVTAKDRDGFARARARGRSRVQDPSTVVDARYDPVRNVIDLTFHGGGSMSIPRRIVPGLKKGPCVCPGDDTPICRWRCSVLAITRCRCLRARIGRARFRHSSVRRGDRPPWWTTKDQGQDGCREGERREGRTPAQGAVGVTDCGGLSTCECSKLVRGVTIVLGHADGPKLWPR